MASKRANQELPVIARFEVRRRNYLAPDGSINRPLPAFAADANLLVALYRSMVLLRIGPCDRAAGPCCLHWAGLDRLRADAIARSIPPEELRGATITLSNFGMIGGRFANLIIVPPQAAIIGAGRISPRAVAHQGQPAVRRVLPLSLTFDHRIVTGGEAARFLVALKSDLELMS